MKELSILDILRCQHVKRWTIVNTAREQSLAEHSFNVAMISRAIAIKMGLDPAPIVMAALDHDLDEVITGDLPTPTKEKLRSRGFNPDDVYPVVKSKMDITQERIIKTADILDAILFLEDHALGRHAHKVKESLIDKLGKYMATNFPPEKQEPLAELMEELRGEYVI